MQSSLRAIVLVIGVLLLVAAVVLFGRLDFAASDAIGPAILAALGASAFAIGLYMPTQRLWRQVVTEDESGPDQTDLHRANVLRDRPASSFVHDME